MKNEIKSLKWPNITGKVKWDAVWVKWDLGGAKWDV